jgi:hypothetical protein
MYPKRSTISTRLQKSTLLVTFNVFSMSFYLLSVLISDQIPSTVKVKNGLSIKTDVPIYNKFQGRLCNP